MTAQPPFLPYARQSIDDSDVAAVAATLRGDWLTQGPAVERFESRLAARVRAPHAVACANGTAALHLAYGALGLGPGDAVVVPAITFLATASTARLVGAEVVFADVDADTGLMTADHAEDAVRRGRASGLRIRAIAPVHLAGQTVDVGGLAGLVDRCGARLVEDACHALGTEQLSAGGAATPVGAAEHGGLAVFSFHPAKTIAAGEGGAVTTADPALAAALRRLRNHGMTRDPAEFTLPELAFDTDGAANPWYYEMVEPGFNHRLTDIQAALADSQLQRLDRFAERRRHLRDLYRDRIAGPDAGLGTWITMAPAVSHCRAVWHLAVALIDFAALGQNRATVMRRLRERGIGTQVHYIPVPWQPYYRERYGVPPLPGAEAYYRRALSLPLFADMTDGDVERVAAALASVAAAAPGRAAL